MTSQIKASFHKTYLAPIKRGTEENVRSTKLRHHFQMSVSQAEHNEAKFPALPTKSLSK
jgi:hypothetical protein